MQLRAPDRIDLHLHTNASDGGVSPAALVQAAAVAALDLIAITDHDTAAGARAAPTSWGRCQVLPGIEISSTLGQLDLHILGYLIDPDHPIIHQHERDAVLQRTARMRTMIEKLSAFGIRIGLEEVLAVAGDAGSLGRPHLARVLVNRGFVPNVGEAFVRFLGDGGTAYAPVELLSPLEAIDRIHAAGGMAVWAHPPLDILEREIHGFAAAGLDGIECYRPRASPSDLQMIEGYGAELGLILTGGSDWHGHWSARLGDFFVKPQEIGDFLRLAGVTPPEAPHL